jgi:Arc/MetJ-type ribon-helix-helix transcriptional regulator
MKQNSLDAEVKVRVSSATKQELQAIAERMGEGCKISDVVREAVRQYLDSLDPKKVRAARIKAADEDALP